jgi:hypothetical protein
VAAQKTCPGRECDLVWCAGAIWRWSGTLGAWRSFGCAFRYKGFTTHTARPWHVQFGTGGFLDDRGHPAAILAHLFILLLSAMLSGPAAFLACCDCPQGRFAMRPENDISRFFPQKFADNWGGFAIRSSDQQKAINQGISVVGSDVLPWRADGLGCVCG